MDMERGTVSKWLRKEGDQVQKGESLVEIMSEKVTFEFPSPASGMLYKILVPNEMEVPIGQAIGIIVDSGDVLTAVDKAIADIKKSFGKPPLTKKKVEEMNIGDTPEDKQAKISPAARILAKEYKIDVARIKGSGPGGRIVREDILGAVGEPKAEESRVIPLTGIRKITAERMAYSFQNIPHSFLLTEIDMSMAKEFRSKSEKTREVQISYNALFVKAVAKALKEHPIFNSTFEKDEIRILNNVNIGLAVSTEKGLVVPVINDADKKTLEEIEEAIEDLVSKARQDRLSMERVRGGTFTISNLGMFEVDSAVAIINPKQAGILSIGQIKDKAQVVGGRITIKPSAVLALSFDHRIADGAPAAEFLKKIRQFLENPSSL